MKTCINCGTKLEDDTLFCSGCGTKQPTPEPSPAKAPTAKKSGKKAIIAVIAIIGGIAGSYNGFVDQFENVETARSTISTQLQRRADLIPNFVSTVKGYSDYEKETYTAVTEARSAVGKAETAGEQAEADFINIVAWRQTAEFVTKYFQKGSMIGIEGSIQTRRYVDKETGKNRTAFEVVANNVQFVESKRDGAAPSSSEPASFSNAGANDFADLGDVTDDDLPF